MVEQHYICFVWSSVTSQTPRSMWRYANCYFLAHQHKARRYCIESKVTSDVYSVVQVLREKTASYITK